VHEFARALAEPVVEKTLSVTVRDETDVVTVRFLGDSEATPLGLGTNLVLGRVAEREHRVSQLLRRQGGKHVRLVLALVRTATQLRNTVPYRQPRVVSGGHRVEAQRDRLVQQRLELDFL